MFILYAIPFGVAIGVLARGRLAGLADIRFRAAWLFVAGLMVQVALFSDAVSARIGDAGAPIYVASTATVLLAIVINHAIPGLRVVAVGAASNLAAIIANGGYMPADPAALAAAGIHAPSTYSNSAVLSAPVLQPLTDLFVLPHWVPFHNIFSVGDVVIGAGVVVTIVVAMRRTRPRGRDAAAVAVA